MSNLREEAKLHSAQHRPQFERDIDWELVEDARIAYHAAADYRRFRRRNLWASRRRAQRS